MSEELLQRNLVKNPENIGKWDFYNIGATSVKALKEYGIIRSVNYGAEEKKKVDALIVQNKNVIAIIEYKKPSEFKTKAQQDKAIKQEIEVAKKLKCNLIIATDTKDTVWVNALTGKRIKDKDGNELKTLFDPKAEKIADLIEKINESINEKNNQIKPKKLVNPTDLAKQIWQDIWSVSGATPENCLYTFVELFIFKYLSDLGILKGIYSFNTLLEGFDNNEDQSTLDHYANIIRPKIKDLFPQNSLDKTTIINGTIFVSKDQKAVAGYSTVFKKVLEKFQKYGKLEHIEPDFKSQLFESFLKESISKKNWGQFFTPLKVIRAITEMAKDDIKPNIKICDPACGVGKFLLEPIAKRISEFFPVKNNTLEPKITIHGFDKGFDKDEQKTIILAKANMLIYFSDLIQENQGITDQFADVFNKSFVLKTNSILGTLSDPVENEYDLILTNPPYVMSGSSNLKEEIKKSDLQNYYKINAMGVEGLFMEWIIKALKPGGKAFVVIPDGILNRQSDKILRKYILDECYIDGIISLPLNTFFTTPQKTYIICLTKKINKKDIQTHPVFTYLVSEVGETRDIYRFDIEQNDLQEAVTLFSFFKGNKENFEKINSDKRCKIESIEKLIFSFETNWIIDRWWTDEEKIELGIKKQMNAISLEEFPFLLENVACNIMKLSEEVKSIAKTEIDNINYKTLKIKNIFDIKKGQAQYTNKYIQNNKGSYPLYSSQTVDDGIIGLINTFDFDEQCLTWTTDGIHAGTIFLRNNKFSMTTHCGALIFKNNIKNISLDYIYSFLKQNLKQYAEGQQNKRVTVNIIKNVEIKIPINKNGEFDLEAQKQIAEKYKKIEDIKSAINLELDKIAKTEIEL